MSEPEEFGYTCISYPGESATAREEYDFFVTNIDREKFMYDLSRKASHLIEEVNKIFRVKDRSKSSQWYWLELDTAVHEAFYQYAVEGVPGFLMVEGREKRHIEIARDFIDSEFGVVDFWYEWSAMEALNILTKGFESLLGTDQRCYSLDVVVNKFCARLKLDAAMYGQEAWLSIPEVAHLACMKTKSVRNAVRKEIDVVSHTKTGMSIIRADHALEWLKSRRKFVPSYQLESKDCIEVLMALRIKHAGLERPFK